MLTIQHKAFISIKTKPSESQRTYDLIQLLSGFNVINTRVHAIHIRLSRRPQLRILDILKIHIHQHPLPATHLHLFIIIGYDCSVRRRDRVLNQHLNRTGQIISQSRTHPYRSLLPGHLTHIHCDSVTAMISHIEVNHGSAYQPHIPINATPESIVGRYRPHIHA